MHLLFLLLTLFVSPVKASDADLVVPDLTSVTFHGLNGHNLLLFGLIICLLGMVFGFVKYIQIKKLTVHEAMSDVSAMIYETCKTYLQTQAIFLGGLWAAIAVVIAIYFGFLNPIPEEATGIPTFASVAIILAFSVIGILGSLGVAAFGIRINTLANCRAAFAALRGKPFPVYSIPTASGMSIGMMLISVELALMLGILLFVPGNLAGPCFIGFAIGESLGAAALRIAGGIFTKIADIGSDLMKIEFNLPEDDPRNSGVIADCTGDNAGDSVGPTADGFETYGVTGVALITLILLTVSDPTVQIQLLVWIFSMRVMMIATSAVSYYINEAWARARYSKADEMDFEVPLTTLVWLTSIISIAVTYITSYVLIPELGDDTSVWWKLATIITCGTIAAAVIPEGVKVFTSTKSAHVRELLKAAKEGGASLNILGGIVAGYFSAFWLVLAIAILMLVANSVGETSLANLMVAPSVFCFGLVAFGFLGMGPVTIAVDSYGPVSDNAQSVYELSQIEGKPGIAEDIHKRFGFTPLFELAKKILELADGAGNTFKATAKPVLIGTAAVGATALIFGTVMMLSNGLTDQAAIAKLSLMNPNFLVGLLVGGAVIFWFSGAATQAVSVGAFRAVAFIKKNMKLDAEKASVEDSKKVVAICTKYAQKGMLNIFLAVFFGTLAYACFDSFFFIGYLIGIAFVGLFQAIFMANAGGAWDNGKKLVETDPEHGGKGTKLHADMVVGDTVGDPFKDTSSVALNPIIKFTTLFGLIAVEFAENLPDQRIYCAAVFFALQLYFVWRSFYRMRIEDK